MHNIFLLLHIVQALTIILPYLLPFLTVYEVIPVNIIMIHLGKMQVKCDHLIRN